jgi:hypothetical protein
MLTLTDQLITNAVRVVTQNFMQEPGSQDGRIKGAQNGVVGQFGVSGGAY